MRILRALEIRRLEDDLIPMSLLRFSSAVLFGSRILRLESQALDCPLVRGL
jgi:hypothetical protein